ncbi:hypothetical protein MBT84_19935 [Streptomyces sp. MBT84]|uniref:hypothetical protein n=1 Tax=Streptomyces sp. MBT84 TaxID=1488414 RepID=UPI001C6DEF84|nr:hypothetical protein [Streptomyces sp. MBT84]MBW8701881.1 hypothetical protein [Streptomyces sp. MBT84]
MATDDVMVAALLREREGLVQSGLTDRIASVDEQLKLHGYEPVDEKGASTKPSTRSTTPKGRKTRSSETT